MNHELHDLGLSDNEIQVYLALLKAGPLTSYELSEKTSLNRGYLYELLKRLHEKGIISELTEEGKKKYQATDPEQLAALLEFKLENLRTVLPQLKKLPGQLQQETKINVYRGRYCYKTLLQDMIATLQPNSETYIFGINERDVMNIEPVYLKRYFSLVQKKSIKEKVILRKGTTQLQEAKTTQYRALPGKYIGKIPYFIYGNKVALLTISEPMNTIILEDQAIADTYTKQFMVFWKMAKCKKSAKEDL